MRELEVRRHARRDPRADRLTPEGRIQAEELGRSLGTPFAVIFVSPAERAAETVALVLRGMGAEPSPHEVVASLAGLGEGGQEPERMAAVLHELLALVPEGSRGLAVGHTPLIERAVEALTGVEIDPLGECEGVLLTQGDDLRLSVEELRSGPAA